MCTFLVKNTFIILSICVSASFVYAQPLPEPGMTPPPQALDACANKEDGVKCSFFGIGGKTVYGACETNPENQNVCSPNAKPMPTQEVVKEDVNTYMPKNIAPIVEPEQQKEEVAVTKDVAVNTSSTVNQDGFWKRLFYRIFGWLFRESKNTPTVSIKETKAETVTKNMVQPAKKQTIDNVQQDEEQEDTAEPESVESPNVSFWSIPDTGQKSCYNNSSSISCPAAGSSFYGQDANYNKNPMGYTDNGDGTVTDNVTGLMWIKDAGDKTAYYSGVNSVNNFSYAGYSDWRVPTIKELYSLIDFSGRDIDPMSSYANTPFIDDAFVFTYGNTLEGDRIIDSQWITGSIYVATVMNNQECFFGVNFADGRIKCYPTADNGRNNGYFLRLVRGNSGYGENSFVDNGNGTVTDNSTALMWQKSDSGSSMDWQGALNYCENLSHAGYSDWRLPNTHELEYIVDYSRSPNTTNSPSIDPIFETTSITNESGQKDWPYFWTGTTHANASGGSMGSYISFGRALGKMNGQIMDVHGAGAQRSDPKSGNASEYPQYHGPQGDTRRVYNYARCVRN